MSNWKLYVRRKFDAAHHLPHHAGKCKQVHGHTWTVEVEVTYSGILSNDGMIMDFGDIKEVIDKLDHIDLNMIISNPTAENITKFLRTRIWDWMSDYDHLVDLANAKVLVRVWESDNTYVELS